MVPKMRSILWDESRHLVLYGGAGSAKSYSAAQKLIYRTLSEKNIIIAVVRQTFRSHLNSTYALLKHVVSTLGLEKHFTFTTSPLEINNILGSKIIFVGVDDIEKIKSLLAHSIWIEEATELSDDDITQLDLRLRGVSDHYKQIIFSFNPVSIFSPLKKRFFDTKNDSVNIIHSTYKDNPFVGKEYEKQMEQLSLTNPRLYQIYALGEWGIADEGLIFPNTQLSYQYEWKDMDGLPTALGCDWGFTDPSLLIQCWYDKPNRTIYIKEILYQTNLTVDDFIGMMKARDISKRIPIFADSSRPEMIEQVKRAGFNMMGARKEKDSVIAGINFLKENLIVIDKASKSVCNDFMTYSWKKNNGVIADIPDHLCSHSPDAARYCCYSMWFPKPELQTFPRNLIGI